MSKLPEITLSRIYFKKTHQIKISFKYNDQLKTILNAIPKAYWSQTLNSWYIKNNPENLKLLFSEFEDLTAINAKDVFDTSMPLHQYPDKRIRKISKDNRLILNNFYKYLKGKRYSVSTINTYTQLIADFIEYHNEKDTEALTNRDVELFIETIYIKRNYSISTQRQFISALKLFIVFYPRIQINEITLARPKKSKKLPVILSYQEMILLLQNTKNIKHRIILAILYSGGLRISELINLKIEHLHIQRHQILIKDAKGRKDRFVSIAKSILPLLENYLVTYKPKLYLIEGPKRGKYTASSVRKFLHKSSKLAKINYIVTPHTLRHSYATHLLEQGVGLRHIQELLGHSRPETTMIYTHVARKDLLDIKSPLDNAVELLRKNQNQEQKFHISRNN
ncbi:tyrosine-type recombinase/integrase [Psychroserpens sp. NJDZ02]|uniref:tyrosine-type recombinase/integrase n=1 Tax=Psychroserpens sp. NJDZ02 TaxID=2570561 RepID=UPI0010A7EB18|nr:site-specific integrase [Psychroserpens sp. NJDZ02]QCE40888.1 integrase [Psychroserpens sp. NJDZ02]